MSYSRRNFLKAAGSGIALTTVGAGAVTAVANAAAAPLVPVSPLAIPAPMTSERATFKINGKSYPVEYEARTTLWEVIAVKLGMTGTNRSCNRASCGACSVLVDDKPIYSCHTLAMEAAGKKILTIEGVGDEKKLHPLQQIGNAYVAASCGFCTPGWVVTAKGLLDKNPNPSEDEVRAELAGHICRCAVYPKIIHTVMDAAKVVRGEKFEIKSEPMSTIVFDMPMVRDYSTSGGHDAGNKVVDGNEVTNKWQGYPPENLNVVGKSLPALPEVSIPRFTGTAEYATRVWFPNMLYARFLTTPHPHSRIRSIDTSVAEKMPGVVHILTAKDIPYTTVNRGGVSNIVLPFPDELNLAGEVVAIVAAETEDLAEEAVEAIRVDYEVLPFASNLEQVMAPGAPELREGGNLYLLAPNATGYSRDATWEQNVGDIDKGFAEADVVKEFTYPFAGAVSIPIQPAGSVAKWDGDKLTFWGMGQGIHPVRDALAQGLGIPKEKVRFINKYNGCTFGSARLASERFYVPIAHLAKVAARPVKAMFTKGQELAQLQIKPETLTKFKVGAKKGGRIVAFTHEVWVAVGDSPGGGHASGPGQSTYQLDLYTTHIPNWISRWSAYKTNGPRPGPSRSYLQQETKWSWESMMDEMAEAVGVDPVEFRLLHATEPGDRPYDTFPSREVLQEGAKVFGWDKRNPIAGGNPGRFKRGLGMGMSQHHAGGFAYHDGEEVFARLIGAGNQAFGTEVELGADGNVTMKSAMSDSGSNNATGLSHMVAEILGYTTRDHIRLIWGDSETTPPTQEWYAGRTTPLQGASICRAADKLRTDLVQRAAVALKVDGAKLQVRDGVISSMDEPRKKITFAALAKANQGVIRQTGRAIAGGASRGPLNRGVGACFVEVEVDTWTGDWKFIRSVYVHDSGLVISPMVVEGDMIGSLVESTQLVTDPIPWDREFPGTQHYSVGYLSYRLPTIMDVPREQTQIYVNSLEPRLFFGAKGFSETSIGAVPGAIANAIYNACGVRIREHPITREKIMSGLKNSGARV